MVVGEWEVDSEPTAAMSGRATVGDVRPLSSAPGRTKSFRAVLSVTVTVCVMLILCAIQPAESQKILGKPIRTQSSALTEGTWPEPPVPFVIALEGRCVTAWSRRRKSADRPSRRRQFTTTAHKNAMTG